MSTESLVIESTPDGVDILRLHHGKANALDLELCGALTSVLAEARPREGPLVLTGMGSIFSAGVDLFRVVDGGRPYVEQFLPALEHLFLQLFTLPRPVIAAINGHAIAGGCLMACACDYRVMADGTGRIGVPELAVGVPFPPSAIELLRAVNNPAHVEELVYMGRTYDARAAASIGLVNEVVPPEQAVARAVDVARDLGARPARSFRLTKQFVRGPAAERIRAALPGRQELIDAWASDDTFAAIREYLRRTLKK